MKLIIKQYIIKLISESYLRQEKGTYIFFQFWPFFILFIKCAPIHFVFYPMHESDSRHALHVVTPCSWTSLLIHEAICPRQHGEQGMTVCSRVGPFLNADLFTGEVQQIYCIVEMYYFKNNFVRFWSCLPPRNVCNFIA